MKCIVELFGDDRNGRKMIVWGRRIGCTDAGHVSDAERRKVATRLLVDDVNPSQKSYLLELVNPSAPCPRAHRGRLEASSETNFGSIRSGSCAARKIALCHDHPCTCRL